MTTRRSWASCSWLANAVVGSFDRERVERDVVPALVELRPLGGGPILAGGPVFAGCRWPSVSERWRILTRPGGDPASGGPCIHHADPSVAAGDADQLASLVGSDHAGRRRSAALLGTLRGDQGWAGDEAGDRAGAGPGSAFRTAGPRARRTAASGADDDRDLPAGGCASHQGCWRSGDAAARAIRASRASGHLEPAAAARERLCSSASSWAHRSLPW